MNMIIPLDVPQKLREEFATNMRNIMKNSEHLFLFAFDHTIEHLNQTDRNTVFQLASSSYLGAFATHFGLIARYGINYPLINYIVKINSKTNLIDADQADPESIPLYSVDDIMTLKRETGLAICGVGLTIYPGSLKEPIMLQVAAQTILKAHQNGLVAIVWMYPRGCSIQKEDDPNLIAGCVAMANALGADFIKVKPPRFISFEQTVIDLKRIVAAAGNSRVIISGGSLQNEQSLLQQLKNYIAGDVCGFAVGRNLFERNKDENSLLLLEKIAQLLHKKDKSAISTQ